MGVVDDKEGVESGEVGLTSCNADPVFYSYPVQCYSRGSLGCTSTHGFVCVFSQVLFPSLLFFPLGISNIPIIFNNLGGYLARNRNIKLVARSTRILKAIGQAVQVRKY